MTTLAACSFVVLPGGDGCLKRQERQVVLQQQRNQFPVCIAARPTQVQ